MFSPRIVWGTSKASVDRPIIPHDSCKHFLIINLLSQETGATEGQLSTCPPCHLKPRHPERWATPLNSHSSARVRTFDVRRSTHPSTGHDDRRVHRSRRATSIQPIKAEGLPDAVHISGGHDQRSTEGEVGHMNQSK